MFLTPGTTFRISLLLSAMLLTACGGGGGSSGNGGNDDSSGNKPPSPQSPLTIESPASKSLQLSWEPVEGALSYRLLLNIDGQSGYEPATDLLDSLEPDPETGRLSHTFENLSLHTLINASYILQVCDSEALCTDTPSRAVAEYLQGAIGYLKAASPQSGAGMGYRMVMSADGSTIATNGGQRVLVFAKDGNGIWQQQANLTPAVTELGSPYGMALDISDDGNTLAVSNYTEDSAASGINGNQIYSNCDDADTENDVNCLASSGAAYVYIRDGGGNWSEQAYFKADVPKEAGFFGKSITLNGNGNVLAVGSMGYGINRIGAVYLFERADSDWSQTDVIEGFTSNRRLGYSVALNTDGTRLAAAEYSGANASVYVFALQTGNWVQQQQLNPPSVGSTGEFGTALDFSLDGNTLAIADQADRCVVSHINNPAADSCAVTESFTGAVHIYQYDSSWTRQAYIKPSNMDGGDYFGHGISLTADGNLLVVGAPREGAIGSGFTANQNNNDGNLVGAAYLFKREDGQWQQSAYLKAPNSAAGDQFGASVALSADGSQLVVGARYEDGSGPGMAGDQNSNGRADSGALYLY
ncbi:FG-GAP repeat protein [Alcanivorax sediminis]|nr:FG-GAP repeat protein [Alcanivorax sediminis]